MRSSIRRPCPTARRRPPSDPANPGERAGARTRTVGGPIGPPRTGVGGEVPPRENPREGRPLEDSIDTTIRPKALVIVDPLLRPRTGGGRQSNQHLRNETGERPPFFVHRKRTREASAIPRRGAVAAIGSGVEVVLGDLRHRTAPQLRLRTIPLLPEQVLLVPTTTRTSPPHTAPLHREVLVGRLLVRREQNHHRETNGRASAGCCWN